MRPLGNLVYNGRFYLIGKRNNKLTRDKKNRERTFHSTHPLRVQSVDSYLGYSEGKDNM